MEKLDKRKYVSDVPMPHSIELKPEAQHAYVKLFLYLKKRLPSRHVRLPMNSVIEHALIETAKTLENED